MEEFSTARIPASARSDDQRRPSAHAGPRRQEDRLRVQSFELEPNQEDDEPASGEPQHEVDISV